MSLLSENAETPQTTRFFSVSPDIDPVFAERQLIGLPMFLHSALVFKLQYWISESMNLSS